MDYQQHNPLPVPESGDHKAVQSTTETIFDWKYALEQKNLLHLYEKGKTASWNASDVDWSSYVSLEERVAKRQDPDGPTLNETLNPPRPLSPDERLEFSHALNAFLLSQFLHGEQGALIATAKIVQIVPSSEAKFYASNQVADEARHVEVYHRYLTEKLGSSFEINKSLEQLLDIIVQDPRWDMTCLGMQVMVEGLALAAFGMMKFLMPDEPLIIDLTDRVIGDEARHVAFGVLSLEKLYPGELTPAELREREEFVIGATELLRERLELSQVFERLGWDVDEWTEWTNRTPFMRGFRQMTFSKVVPNLKRLGLLTPRVRDAYEKLDILKYETMADSVEEPEPPAPEELAQRLAQEGSSGGTEAAT
ncbi:MAG: ferritin-like domain-containing protein [bacterium]|nr:ferritin-like domain-containing protein [bacterium]